VAHVSRILGSVADVSVATGQVASLLLNQTGGLAATTSTAVQAVSSSTLSIAQAAWSGVDLLNMTGRHRVGSALIDDAEFLRYWLHSPEGMAITGCNLSVYRALWINTAQQISVELPFLATKDKILTLDGSYSETQIRVSLAWSGQLFFQYTCMEISFVPIWANPFWDALQFDISSEIGQITEQVEHFGSSLPTFNISWNMRADNFHANLPPAVLQQGKYRRHLRAISLELAYYVASLDSKWGVGMAVVGIFFLVAGSLTLWKGTKEGLSLLRKGIIYTAECLQSLLSRLWEILSCAFNRCHSATLTALKRVLRNTAWLRDYGFELVQEAS